MSEIMKEVLGLMGVNPENTCKIGGTTYVNNGVSPEARSGIVKYYGCYYIDKMYDWGFDSPMDGIGCNFVTAQELEDGSADRVDLVDTVENEFPGLRGINRKKFRLALEKLCTLYDRSDLCVNVVFATPAEGNSEVMMVQVVDSESCWTL